MDILIKNMEMPKECRGCRFHHIHKIWSKNIYLHECDAQMLAEETEGMEAVKLPKACPLIALPSHGRLGDLDLVEEWMRKKHKEHDCPFNIDAFLFALKKIPTIVEATE